MEPRTIKIIAGSLVGIAAVACFACLVLLGILFVRSKRKSSAISAGRQTPQGPTQQATPDPTVTATRESETQETIESEPLHQIVWKADITQEEKSLEEVKFTAEVVQEVCSTIFRFCIKNSLENVYIPHGAIVISLSDKHIIPTTLSQSIPRDHILLVDSGHLEKGCIKSWFEGQICKDSEGESLTIGTRTIFPSKINSDNCFNILLDELIGLVTSAMGIRFGTVDGHLTAHAEQLVERGLKEVAKVSHSLNTQHDLSSEERTSGDTQISRAITREANTIQNEIISESQDRKILTKKVSPGLFRSVRADLLPVEKDDQEVPKSEPLALIKWSDKVTEEDKEVEMIRFASSVIQAACGVLFDLTNRDTPTVSHVKLSENEHPRPVYKWCDVFSTQGRDYDVCSIKCLSSGFSGHRHVRIEDELKMTSGHLDVSCFVSDFVNQIHLAGEDLVHTIAEDKFLPSLDHLIEELTASVIDAMDARFNTPVGMREEEDDTPDPGWCGSRDSVSKLIQFGVGKALEYLPNVGTWNITGCRNLACSFISKKALEMENEIIVVEPAGEQTEASITRLQSQENAAELESDQQQPPL